MKTVMYLVMVLLYTTASAQSDDNKIYQVVQQMPEFAGGADSLRSFLIRHVVYPQAASDSLIQGRVYVGFVVEKDGSLSDIIIKKGVHKLLDEEALRVVKAFPKYSPGIQNGKAVKVAFMVPVSFKISVTDTSTPDIVLPSFPGGDEAMKDFIKKNLHHPGDSLAFLGSIPIKFTVDTNGAISDIHTELAVSDRYETEAVRVIGLFPHLSPAVQKGKKISLAVTVSVSFFDEKYVMYSSKHFYNGTILDRQPTFPDGLKGKKDFMTKYVLPIKSLSDKRSTLTVYLTSDADSSVSDIHIIDGEKESTDHELISAMQHLRRFTPGVYKGVAVRTQVTFEIDTFSSPMAMPVIESMPGFPGGERAMMKFIQEQIQYPVEERDNNVQGGVVVGFTITSKGKLTNVRIAKSVSPGIDKEALRVVHLLPDFIPGSQQGRAVSLSFMLPIMFRLGTQD